MKYILKEISNMPPARYKVIDEQQRKGNELRWNDRIEILINGHNHKNVSRKGAYKYGLCGKADY